MARESPQSAKERANILRLKLKSAEEKGYGYGWDDGYKTAKTNMQSDLNEILDAVQQILNAIKSLRKV